jgi:hypothetical protein
LMHLIQTGKTNSKGRPSTFHLLVLDQDSIQFTSTFNWLVLKGSHLSYLASLYQEVTSTEPSFPFVSRPWLVSTVFELNAEES